MVFWRCERKLRCNRTLKASGITITATTGVNNHAPEATSADTTTVTSEIVTQAVSTQESTQTIIQAAVGAALLEAAAQLSSIHSWKSKAQRECVKSTCAYSHNTFLQSHKAFFVCFVLFLCTINFLLETIFSLAVFNFGDNSVKWVVGEIGTL